MPDRKSCNHRFRYYTVVGLAVPGHVVGTVDLWKCTNCGAIDANPRRIGDLKPPSTVGFTVIDEDQEWMILTCFDNPAPDNWELVLAKPGMVFEHKCKGPETKFRVDEKMGLHLEDNSEPKRHEFRSAEKFGEQTILIVPE
ncbi:MAG: hypothetical protein QW767_04590 [Thermoprotei archaeon]